MNDEIVSYIKGFCPDAEITDIFDGSANFNFDNNIYLAVLKNEDYKSVRQSIAKGKKWVIYDVV